MKKWIAVFAISWMPSIVMAVQSNSYSLWRNQAGDHVVLEGRWVPVSGRGTVEIPTTNTAHVECDRQSAICTESVAKLITPSDDPSASPEGHLFVFVQKFKIQLWRDGLIIAKAEPRAADIELRISLKGKGMAQRSSTETSARGAENPRPSTDKWNLQ